MHVVPSLSVGAASSQSQSSAGAPSVSFSTRLEPATVGSYNAEIAARSQQNSLQLTSGGAGAYGFTMDLAEMSRQQAQMLSLQIAMQRENIFFTSISNVLKIKHETLKTIISNIR